MVAHATLGVGMLCAGLYVSLVFAAPAYADEEATECPVISAGADSDTTEFQLPDGSECYIGHDEPIVQFFSSKANSASNMSWEFVLPTEDSINPGHQTFQDYWHFQFYLALCDPNSTLQDRVGPCTPNSDNNIAGTRVGPNANTYSGAALLELKFLPPGQPLPRAGGNIGGYSCSNVTTTQWCALMQVQVETNCSTFDYAMNEAWVTVDGNPPQPVFVGINGPPTALANTFLMNPGDRIQVVLKDTPDGLTARVIDKTNDTVGYATASSKFGFKSVTPLFMGCNSVPWSFRPLWNTATAPTSTSPGHTVPWALAIYNVGFGLETGHFEIKDFDTDDRLCGGKTTNPVIPNVCYDDQADVDGPPYQQGAWPPNANGPLQSVRIVSPIGFGIGPAFDDCKQNDDDQGEDDHGGKCKGLYEQMLFETTFRANQQLGIGPGTMLSLIGKSVGANNNFFYPYYSLIRPRCALVIGDYASGGPNVATDFGKQAQYDGGQVRFNRLNNGPILNINKLNGDDQGEDDGGKCKGKANGDD